ncbi:hypothetical protein DL764_009813 [Monosporascus ibericus]|uniref:Glucose-methanol-choline oxidoreductase N-terminal domain-containing protein n=1 Tax=Monosporascus ibericus TaxID=155417 RepID=A0A4V1X8V7_9PEZI|nr:hypothetical protein DL764_009813 [Monosporascus ibericus]
MGLYKALPDNIQEVDIIIAGGGAVGCVVASRLAQADSQLSILVIEGGQDNYNLPQVIHPALFRTNLVPDSATCLHYRSGREEQLLNRELLAPAGGVLGGGSSVNGLLYVRAQQCDYDSWNMTGWSSNDVLPFLKNSETYHGPGDKEQHGYDGPLDVSTGAHPGAMLGKDFVAAMKEVGCPEVEDLQDLRTGHGVAKSYAYVSPKDGRRQDVAHTYLHPQLQDGKHPNLHVLVESQVIRVLFHHNHQASGVEYRPNPKHQSGSLQGPTQTIKATKLIILAAGALGTPPILERSGVGDPEILGRAGVQNICSLPGVGHDYQDHQLLQCYYESYASPSDTLDRVYNGTLKIPDLLANGDKILSWNGFDASSKIRPSEPELEALGHDFREAWDKDFANAPSRPLASMVFYSGILGNPSGLPIDAYFTICTCAAYPYSRGRVHITGPGIDHPVDFMPGYLSDPNGIDMKTHVWVYKKQREVVRRMQSYRGAIISRHPQFPQGSKASFTAEVENDQKQPASLVKRDIEYSPEDDQAIERWVRENLSVCWHFLGTCKMAPAEEMGVVDESLSVHGVQRLKIADLSIAPKMISANTYSTAMMVGGKAADIFITELGLGKK